MGGQLWGLGLSCQACREFGSLSQPILTTSRILQPNDESLGVELSVPPPLHPQSSPCQHLPAGSIVPLPVVSSLIPATTRDCCALSSQQPEGACWNQIPSHPISAQSCLVKSPLLRKLKAKVLVVALEALRHLAHLTSPSHSGFHDHTVDTLQPH